jgi:hypothetical protein
MSQLRKTLHENKHPKYIILTGGLLAGISEILFTYPLDTIKTHQQIYPERYRGIFHCGSTIAYNTNGLGLYYGIYASLSQVGGKAAIRFTTYDYIKEVLQKNNKDISSNQKNLIAGIISGAIESVIWTAPTERIKILQQKLTNPISTSRLIRNTIKTKGIKSLYQGTVPTILKQSASVGTRFWLYGYLKEMISTPDKEIKIYQTLLIGSIAGGLSTVFNHPIDVIKSNIQANDKRAKEGIIKCGKRLINTKGYQSLWKGINARFIRVALAQGITFAVYESFLSLFK